MSDYSQFAQANPGTDYPVKDAQLRAQLSLDSDKIDSAATGYAFGYKRNTTAGLNVGFYGGVIISGGTLTTKADGTIALTASQTNYVERDTAGVVSKNTSGFTAGKIAMFTAVTDTTDVTAVVDKRQRNVFGDLVSVGPVNVGNASGENAINGTTLQPDQPAFLAYASVQNDVTGDGTDYTVLFANEVFDQGADFAASAFTAPVTGRYALSAVVNVDGLVAANSSNYMTLYTSNRVVYDQYQTAAGANPFVNYTFKASTIFDMEAGDIALVKVNITGGAKVADIVSAQSFFSGCLVA